VNDGPRRAAEPPSLAPDCALFLAGGALQFVVVYAAVPALIARGVPPLGAWMLLAVPLIFVPILAGGLWILRSEPRRAPWRERLWLQRPTREDWREGAWGALAVFAGSAALFPVCQLLGLSPNPPFARGVSPVAGAQLWLLGVWLVYWPFNILGEELVWRGVILPRMQARLGPRAWQLNAALWLLFHLAFGPGNNLILLPTILLVPWITQRRRNTWLAVLLHAAISLPGFIALALGKV
jgi:membrane protease YdiL (CAAX protease family)